MIPLRVRRPIRQSITFENMKPLSQAQLDLIERFGVLYDQKGVRPAAGRIVGLLWVAPEGELTFDEIREALQLSKSATSTSLAFLQGIGSVTYRTRPGDRRRYFRKDLTDWEARFHEESLKFLEVRHLLSEAVELRRGKNLELDDATDGIVEFLEVLAEAVESAFDRWAEQHGAGVGPGS